MKRKEIHSDRLKVLNILHAMQKIQFHVECIN